jgi:dTMP kinase
MNNQEKGKIIVLYGANSLGKTTQAKLLVENLIIQYNKKCEYLKFPIYDLEPTGPLISNYLKQGNQFAFTPREFQILQVLNRTQFEPTLKQKIESGTWIVAEDYCGTGVAWGIASGVDKKLIYKLNQHLISEDIGILFEGESFTQDLDQRNIHESNTELLKRAGEVFKEIARDFGWHTVNANQSREAVQEEILQIIKSKISIVT